MDPVDVPQFAGTIVGVTVIVLTAVSVILAVAVFAGLELSVTVTV